MHFRVSLSEGTFRELVKGVVVKVADISVNGQMGSQHELLVSLQDIGWDRMMKAVQDAYEGRWLTRRPVE